MNYKLHTYASKRLTGYVCYTLLATVFIMKTAFNEMLDYLNYCADENLTPEVFFEWLSENQSRLLEKEKKQITDAFSDGAHECDSRGDWVCDYDDCLDYFNKTYLNGG